MSDKAAPAGAPPVGHVSYPIRVGDAAATGSAPSAATGTTGNKQQQQQPKPPAATGVAPPGYDYYAAHHHHHNSYKQHKQQQSQPNEHKAAAVQNRANGHKSGNQKKMSHGSEDNEDDHPLVESPITPEVGGIYAPLLKVQYQRQMDNAATVPLPPRIIGGLRDQNMEHGNACNCQKSSCLKLYCECYKSGIYCNPHCTCQSSCQNDGAEQHQYYRNKAILSTLQQNPDAFRPRRPTRDEVRQHQQQLEWQQEQQEKLRQGQMQKKISMRQTQDQQMMMRQQQKVAKQKQGTPQHLEEQNPCNCRKSRCLKKYCECFSSGLLCLRWCNCRDCENVPGSKKGLSGDTTVRSASNQPGLYAKTATGAIDPFNSAIATTTGRASAAVGNNNNGSGNNSYKGSGSIPVTSAELATPSAAAIRNRLPPSMVADPMKIINLEIVSLAFGHASTDNDNKRKAPYGGEIDNYMLQTGGAAGAVGVTAEAAAMVRRRQDVLSRDGPPKKAKPQPTRDTQAVRQKEMIEKWAMETQDVTGTFHAMRQELLEREQAAGLRNGDITLSREYSYYDIIGSAQLAAVELDLADVVESVREAGDRARALLEQNPLPADETDDAIATSSDKEHDKKAHAPKLAKENSPTENMEVDKESSPIKTPPDAEKEPKELDPLEESLLCTEEDLEPLKNDPGVRTTSAEEANVAFGTTRENAVVQAAEDAAMMRELARIIRRRALEMRTTRACKYDITP